MMPRPPTTRRPPPVFIAMVAVCGGLNLAVLLWLLLRQPMLNSDFLAFWSFPRFVAAKGGAAIYDPAALQAFQKALYPGFGSFYPYLYPPTLLLVISWLKFLPFAAARALWTLAGFLLLCAGSAAMFGRRSRILLALLASPASLISFSTGETAWFTGGLLLLGLALLPRRGWAAGICFGLLTLKPQLGVLLPFLLLARGDKAAILTAALTAGLLVLLCCLVLPPQMWWLWWRTLPVYQAQYFSGSGLNLNILVTPMANLLVLGLPVRLAWAAQAFCGAGIAAFMLWAGRRAAYPLAVAALLVGSFLAVPHAYAYDTVTLTAAMALCWRHAPPLPEWARALGAVIYLGPLLLLTPAHGWFLYALPETLLFLAIAALAWRGGKDQNRRDEPEHDQPA